MRPSSKSREPAEHNSGPDDFSITRGREPRPEVNPTGASVPSYPNTFFALRLTPNFFFFFFL